MNKRIDIKQFDLEFEKVTEPVSLFVTLTDKFFEYTAEYYSEVPKDKEDKFSVWEPRYNNFDIKIRKDTLVSVELYYNDKQNYWQVEMEFFGYPNVVKIHFQLEKNAREFHKIMDHYVFGDANDQQ
jgi:hypothetical protein